MENKYIKEQFNGLTKEVYKWDFISISPFFKEEFRNKTAEKEIIDEYKHSAIDYARKFNSDIVKEVAFTDSVDRNMSLSSYDSDYFFSDKGNLEDNISNSELRVAIKKLSKDEKKILELSIGDYSGKEIAKIMGLSEKTVRNKKCIIRSKIKRMLGE